MSPPDIFKIALGQLNPTMGDIAGNAAKARVARAEAARLGADVVMLTELFLSGNPPEDLVLMPAFQDACRTACENLAGETADGGPAMLVGLPWVEDGALYNAYALLDAGAIAAVRFKVDLPHDGPMNERRLFTPGPLSGPVAIRGVRCGVPIGEDIGGPDPVETIVETGGEILLVPNGSPFWRGATAERLNVGVSRVTESGLPLVYLNQVCGQDELVFDGASFVLNGDASLACQLPAFRESVALTVWRPGEAGWRCEAGPREVVDEGEEADYAACVLGLRDHVDKNRFPGVVLELSGGIDSALCAAMAVDALGTERVRCVMLPFRSRSSASLAAAVACADALGVRYDILSIADAVEGFETALAPLFRGRLPETSDANPQSRVRGAILMAISNEWGPMVIAPADKSAISVGHISPYGDTSGGFNPVKDLYKGEVCRLAALRNRWKPVGALGPSGEVIPDAIIRGAPSAELGKGQTHPDSLPSYDILDPILEGLVERAMRVSDIVALGHDRETVAEVERLLYVAECKRRQAAPGLKLTRKNFGRDRRYPITNRFRDPGPQPHAPDEALAPVAGKARPDAMDV